MKHTSKVTILLLAFFIITQVLGLYLVSTQVQPNIQVGENQTVVHLNSTLISEVPADIFDWKAILYLVVGITIGTSIILLLRKLKFGGQLWKVWYFLAVYVAIDFALRLIFTIAGMKVILISIIGTIVALLLAFLKVRKHNFYIHNITEILMYSGIGTFIVLLFNNNVLIISILMLIIAAYDAIAVWKSKHMIKLANFTTDNKLFPGFAMNYKINKNNKTTIITKTEKSTKTVRKEETESKTNKVLKTKPKKTDEKQAILGGGDVVFPLIFSGVVLGWLFNLGFSRIQSYGLSLITSAFILLSLYLLFYYGKKDRFYPAIPFIAAGCYVGFGVVYLIVLMMGML